MACSQGSMEIVQLFVSKDPSICQIALIDSQGFTPLHMAALNNHSVVVQFLLKQVTMYIVYLGGIFLVLKLH